MVPRSRRHWAAPALVAVLTLALVPATAGARPPIRALAYRGASSSVLSEVRAQLGHNLRISRATRVRMRHNHRYGLLILDGDALSPAALARRRPAIDRYMDGGGWVLALDVRAGHFARTLDKLTHFSSQPEGAQRSSRAFLFRDAVVYGTPTVIMLDVPPLNPAGSPRAGSSVARAAAADHTARTAGRLIRTRLVHPNTGVEQPDAGDPDVPPYLRQREWKLTVAHREPVGPSWWDDSKTGYGVGVLGAPEQGHQTATSGP